MSGHTPGPWRIGTPPPNGQQTIGTENGLMVAVATTGIGFHDTIANARLIAAAPDLLMSLKMLMGSLKECQLSPYTAMAASEARKAIEKAEGNDK